jgi:hypothetical protein
MFMWLFFQCNSCSRKNLLLYQLPRKAKTIFSIIALTGYRLNVRLLCVGKQCLADGPNSWLMHSLLFCAPNKKFTQSAITISYWYHIACKIIICLFMVFAMSCNVFFSFFVLLPAFMWVEALLIFLVLFVTFSC